MPTIVDNFIRDFFGGGVEDFGRQPAAAGAATPPKPTSKPSQPEDIFAVKTDVPTLLGTGQAIASDVLSYLFAKEILDTQANLPSATILTKDSTRTSNVPAQSPSDVLQANSTSLLFGGLLLVAAVVLAKVLK